jgi:hypothetical protein
MHATVSSLSPKQYITRGRWRSCCNSRVVKRSSHVYLVGDGYRTRRVQPPCRDSAGMQRRQSQLTKALSDAETRLPANPWRQVRLLYVFFDVCRHCLHRTYSTIHSFRAYIVSVSFGSRNCAISLGARSWSRGGEEIEWQWEKQLETEMGIYYQTAISLEVGNISGFKTRFESVTSTVGPMFLHLWTIQVSFGSYWSDKLWLHFGWSSSRYMHEHTTIKNHEYWPY